MKLTVGTVVALAFGYLFFTRKKKEPDFGDFPSSSGFVDHGDPQVSAGRAHGEVLDPTDDEIQVTGSFSY